MKQRQCSSAIAILESGSAGNVASVANAFRRAGAEAKIVRRLEDTGCFCGLVIPGVGSFSTVPKIATALGGKKGIASIRIPVLCICLGMQALFDSSEEAEGSAGLGIMPGKVRRITGNVRLPQLGWNRVKLARRGDDDPLFQGVKDGEYFYFANSFAAFPRSPSCVLGRTKYGQEFATAVRFENIWGVQFHPEKSGKAGQKVIGNFAAICKESSAAAIPSIDINGGKAVRLLQGKEGTEKYYGSPLALARGYGKAGFPLLHVVDLDAAFGRKSQLPLLGKISSQCKGVRIQWAGGMRSERAVREAFSAGAARVVFGTALVRSPGMVRKCVKEFGSERIWASLDFAGNPPMMMIRGWKQETSMGLSQAVKLAESCGVGGLVVSSVDVDGTGNGPDLSLIAKARKLTRLPLVLAGGIRNPKDVKAANGKGADAAIVGRALYDKKIKMEEWRCLGKI
jgi:phosphoribosylformimino-5-aminoimidazole carboxamide ribotide isomerase/imidazole glycerol phosphate synthase glutamine amidotransferase subunit